MEAKLTVRVSRESLANAKRYAERHDTTLTRMIGSYLSQIPAEDPDLADAPLVRALTGIIAPDVTVEDYRQYLQDKYASAE